MTGARLLRGARTALSASDPGQARLRLAGTTMATLVATLVVVGGLVTVAGRPVTVAMPGVVLAMIASMAVRETAPVPQAVTIALLAPASMVGIGLGTLVSGTTVLSDAIFVAVAVSAVFLRGLGPRGTATGMVAFISYFLALFVAVTVEQLPAVAVALVVGALVCVLMRVLLRPRHPDRQLRRMLAALGVRAGDVAELFGDRLRQEELTPRLSRRLRSRADRARETAMAVEQHLDDADGPMLETIGNDELAVRVFDFQLAIENLGSSVGRLLEDNAPEPHTREEAAADLSAVQGFLEDPARRSVVDFLADTDEAPRSDAVPDSAVARLHRALSETVDAWRRVVDPRPDDADATTGEGSDQEDDNDKSGDGDDRAPSPGWGDTARQGTQVGVASALAIIVGTQLSSTRWFWAVIAAFVVYIGTSTRGEILSKGWQRVLGTLAGVVAGVLVATVVGGNTVVAVVLIMVCLFLGLYLMSISPAVMMFFITTMLALLYGLLGQFTVDLLLVRLEETAAGALIGVLVSYVVFPASTRKAVREGVRDFLEELGGLLTRSSDDLIAASSASVPAGEGARALRDSFGELRTIAKPLTDGLAGVSGRSGSRRTMQVLGACEHHGRMLSRLADGASGVAAAPQSRRSLGRAAQSVRANVDAFAGGVGARMSEVTVHPATVFVDDLDQVAAQLSGPDCGPLLAVARHLRAVDQAICTRASELGASTASPADQDDVDDESTGDVAPTSGTGVRA